MAVSSERRDIQDAYKTVWRQRSNDKWAATRTLNIQAMLVTLLVTQVPMGRLNDVARYSTAADE